MKETLLKFWNVKSAYVVFSLLAAFLVFPSFFEYTVTPLASEKHLWNSLDPSWAITLNYINNHHFIWGKEFAFTYGPLSYLSTRIAWGCNKYIFFLYDLFCYLNFFLIFYYSLCNNKNKVLTFISIIIIATVVPTYLGGANALVLFLFLVFWLVRNIEEVKKINYIFQIILLCLLFFIKFNTGLISIILYTIVFAYIMIKGVENRVKTALIYLIPFVLIFLLSYVFNLEIISYVISGIEVVSGYNEIMFNNDSTFIFDLSSQLILFLSVLILVINLITQRSKEQFLKNITYLGIFSISIFILYKQAFVRADIGHIMEFFKYVVLLILCTKIFFDYKWFNLKSIIITITVLIPFYICFKNYGSTLFDYKEKANKTVYFNQFSSFSDTSGFQLHPNNNQLPETIKQKIGSNTVDVFPWDIYMLLENKLNYLPRPIIQSYCVYTKYLEEQNFNFYNSEKAPKFVLYDYVSLDYRYPLFDEAKVNLVLFKNYKVAETFTFNERQIILLERKENAKPVKLIFNKEYAILSGAPLIPKKDIFYEVEFFSTLKGKAVSIINHAPEIKVSIKKNNNGSNEYRTSNSLLKVGIFSDYQFNSTQDYLNYYNNIFKEENKIKCYSFFPLHEGYYNEKVKITEYKITQ